MATAAPKIDLAQIAANMRSINPNLPSAAPAAAPQLNMDNASFDTWRNAPGPIGPGTQYQTAGPTQGAQSAQQNAINVYAQQKPIQQPVQQAAPAAANPASGMGNAQSYIDQLVAAQKNAAISALGKSRDNALSNLSAEKSAIQPKYQDARNQASSGAQQQARNFAEYMASRGGASSGANAQAQISNNMALQGNLGSLGRQETAAYTDIGRRTTDVGNAYESDVVSASAGLEADRMKALLNDYYVAQQRGDTKEQNDIQNKIAQAQLQLQQQGQSFDQGVATAGLTGQYNGQTTVQQQQNLINNGLNLAGLTGNYNGQDTLAKTNADRGYGLDLANMSGNLPGGGQTLQSQQLSADNAYRDKAFDRENFVSDRSFELAKSGQEWGQMMQKETFDFNKAQTIWDNNFKDKSFNQSMKEAAESRGLQWASLEQRDKEFLADQTFREKSFSADQEQRQITNGLNQAKQSESQFNQGLEAFKTTGEMPDFMNQFGISSEAFNNKATQQDVISLYESLTSGQMKPKDALKTIDDKVKLGLESSADADIMRNAVYTLYPELSGKEGSSNSNSVIKPPEYFQELNDSVSKGVKKAAGDFSGWWVRQWLERLNLQ